MSTRHLRFLLAAVGIAVTVAFLVVVAGEDESAGPDPGVTLSDVLDDPEDYLGEVVTVSGEVERLDPRPGAFTIGEQPDAQENELFVLPKADSGYDPQRLDADSVVRVEGRVRRVSPPEDDDGGLHDDYEDDAVDEFEGELGIDATRIEVLPR